MTCQDTATVTGKHLLFLGVETLTWTDQQFIDAAQFARAHGVDSLLVKFAEGGIVWYNGIDGFRRIRDAIKAQGVGVVPYMYSYGDTYGFLDGELNLLAEYMQDNGVVCADMEVEWNGHVDWASRMNARLQPLPGVFLVSTWADPFQQDWGGIIRALNPCVNAYLPQQYTLFLASSWQQFLQSGAACLQPTVDLSQEFGINDPVAIASAAYNQGHTALSVWYYGFAVNNPDLLDAVFNAFPKGVTPVAQPPSNPYDTNPNIRQELDACWNSTAQLFGGTPAPMNTGIHDSWVKAWIFHNYQFGPPITREYMSVDSDGNQITVQECARARCEWDKFGVPHWFSSSGPVTF